MRQGCEAFIYLIANAKGDALEITRMNDEHSHEKSEIFAHLPNQRRVTLQKRTEVLELMELKAIKKLIQHKMQAKIGKFISFKDIANIYTSGNN